MSRRVLWWFGGLVVLGATVVIALKTDRGKAAAGYAWTRIRGGYTIDERLEMHSGDVLARVAPQFGSAGVAYPPRQVAMLAFKDSRLLELHARDSESAAWTKVASYPIIGMSGKSGPKLREGDRQVPEGVYRAESLNPNSMFHLSIRLNYPNAFDRAQGAADGRSNLGSDIMIHGSSSSIGCLAMGNEVAENLFVIAALAGKENVRIVVSPTDFRKGHAAPDMSGPPWVATLYEQIRVALLEYPD